MWPGNSCTLHKAVPAEHLRVIYYNTITKGPCDYGIQQTAHQINPFKNLTLLIPQFYRYLTPVARCCRPSPFINLIRLERLFRIITHFPRIRIHSLLLQCLQPKRQGRLPHRMDIGPVNRTGPYTSINFPMDRRCLRP